MSSDHDNETAQQRIATRRKRRRSDDTLRGALLSGVSSPVVLLLTVGLFFCLVDVIYIARYIHQQAVATVQGLQEQREDENIKNDAAGSIKDGKSQQRRPVARGSRQTLPVQHWDSNLDDPDDKTPIIQLVHEATGTAPDAATIATLPTVRQVADMYGRSPQIWGLADSCTRFQQYGNPIDHFIATAGTFNTGTNLMAELLIANCYMPQRRAAEQGDGVRWQVVWGKHTPVYNETIRQHHRTYNDSSVTADNMFPIVTIRDPYQWMQSMCRHPYGAEWDRGDDQSHCPNLIDAPVSIEYAAFTQRHDSLVHFWNEWYGDYLAADFPRLIVRFEDVIFHPKEITQAVCECAGGRLKQRGFKYVVESAKKGNAHGTDKTSYTDALIKYGRETGRYKGMRPEDLEYAKQQLDPRLMEWFNYRYPPQSQTDVAAANSR